MASNHVHNITIVGAGGSVGSYITTSLLAQNKHTITALTRPDSTTTFSDNIHAIKRIAYDDHAALVSALTDQDVLIITLNVAADSSAQKNLVDAAIAANVPWIMPNEYGGDHYSDLELRADTRIGVRAVAMRAYIEESATAAKSRSKWISLMCGFWYEFSLAGNDVRYGFDFKTKKLTLFDDGIVKISTSTWAACGEAVAKIFALPIEAGTDDELSLNRFANAAVPIASFTISQRDMFASVLRVTGGEESEWTIVHEDSRERYKRGVRLTEEGDIMGYAIMLYTRHFYPGTENHESRSVNEKLGLPKESLDEATKFALQLVEEDMVEKKYGNIRARSTAWINMKS